MYKKGAKGWLKHLDFIIIDLICLEIAMASAYFIRHSFVNLYLDPMYRNMAMVIALMEICVVVFFDSMKNVLKRGYYIELLQTIKHVLIVMMATSFYMFMVQEGDYFSRMIIGMMGVIYGILSYITRILWKIYIWKRVGNKAKRSLMIVTVKELAQSTVEKILDGKTASFKIAGIALMDTKSTGESIGDVLVVADKDSLIDYVKRQWVDEVLINVPKLSDVSEELVDKFSEMGITVHVKIAESDYINGNKQLIEKIGRYTVLTTSINYASGWSLLIKRIVDIIGGIVGCIITGILFIIIGPMIYIKSPGPIFFSQERVGKGGKKFRIYKFRSMYMDAEARKAELMQQNTISDGMMFKIQYDPRIIGTRILEDGTIKKGIGNYIRDFSLDEFPQFFNILKGDMSLVGTRPPTVDEWEKYDLHHRARLAIKPGLTGMWQVSGRSKITDFEEVVKLDKKYITDWSLLLDIKILFKTILVVIKKEGSC